MRLSGRVHAPRIEALVFLGRASVYFFIRPLDDVINGFVVFAPLRAFCLSARRRFARQLITSMSISVGQFDNALYRFIRRESESQLSLERRPMTPECVVESALSVAP